MADISKITLPSGTTYNLKDATARGDSSWKVATATTPFELYTDSSPINYRKVNGVVEIHGVVKPKVSITGSATTYTICTLPTGYRPTVNRYYLCQGSVKDTWLLTITTAGECCFSRYGTTSYGTAASNVWLPFSATFIAG